MRSFGLKFAAWYILTGSVITVIAVLRPGSLFIFPPFVGQALEIPVRVLILYSPATFPGTPQFSKILAVCVFCIFIVWSLRYLTTGKWPLKYLAWLMSGIFLIRAAMLVRSFFFLKGILATKNVEAFTWMSSWVQLQSAGLILCGGALFCLFQALGGGGPKGVKMRG